MFVDKSWRNFLIVLGISVTLLKDANKTFLMEDIQEVDQFKEVKNEQGHPMSELQI